MFFVNKKKSIKLSCIFLIDEFPWNDYIPWKISLNSALNISDEIIVVKGNKNYSSTKESVDSYIKRLNNDKIKIIEYSWTEKFSWFEIAHALNFGLLSCTGDWCFRLLMDEIAPYEQFHNITHKLTKLNKYDVVSIGRYYLIGNAYVYPYIQKEFFFRNKSNYVYGRVNQEQESSLLYDNPVGIMENTAIVFFNLIPE